MTPLHKCFRITQLNPASDAEATYHAILFILPLCNFYTRLT